MDRTIKARIVSALTGYDNKQASNKRGLYNPWALPQYFKAVDAAEERIAGGKDLRTAICYSFNGRLLDVVLKAAGLAKATNDEIKGWR